MSVTLNLDYYIGTSVKNLADFKLFLCVFFNFQTFYIYTYYLRKQQALQC